MIRVQLRAHGEDLALAEGIVERIVDGLRETPRRAMTIVYVSPVPDAYPK